MIAEWLKNGDIGVICNNYSCKYLKDEIYIFKEI